jgi:hypothetical protein
MAEPKRVIHENLARLMSKEDREKYGIETMDEVEARQEIQLEKELHELFIQYLNRKEYGYYHAAMDKKSPFVIGMPDFGVYRNSRIIWIEFKIGKKKLREEQRNQVAKMLTDGNEVRVCYNYADATNEIEKFFKEQ